MMLPILEFYQTDQPIATSELSTMIADHFNLSDEDRLVTIAPGRLRYKNRVAWAVGRLTDAGLLEKVAEGEYKITALGKDVVDDHLDKIDLKFLARFPSWVEARRPQIAKPYEEASFPSRVGRTRVTLRLPSSLVQQAKVYCATNPNKDLQDVAARGLELFLAATNGSEEQILRHEVDSEQSIQTPNEILEKAYQTLRRSLAQDLLGKLKQVSPAFFERLVLDLLIKMGYGGSRPEAGSVTARGADGGIDGVIKEDKLGLDVIHVQAKRWGSTVGRPELQAFAGSLEGNRAQKGVFITTSQFSPDAKPTFRKSGKRLSL